MISTRELRTSEPIKWGLSIVLFSFILNYIVSGYSPRTWVGLFLATSMFWLALTGIILFLAGLRRPFDTLFCLLLALAIAVPVSGLFAASYFAVQFFDMGGDKYGECPSLLDAVAVSHNAPASKSSAAEIAVYCGNGRSGMFLWPYDSLAVYGVTDATAQKRIVDNVLRYHDEARTYLVRMEFYDQENWIQHKGKNGPGWGERGPEKLIRTVILR